MSSPLPLTQKAWYIVRQGSPERALVLKKDLPVPRVIPKGEILIKIQAAALNPGGYKTMYLLPGSLLKRVAECDFTGEVVDSNGSSEFKLGDQVFGVIHPFRGLRTKQGALTSYAFVPEATTAHRPLNISVNEAAGIASTGVSAYHLVFTIAGLESGQSLFVNGGSSCIGLYAIQLAKARGCRVTASASGRNEELVRSMGADEFFDYTVAPLHEQLVQNPPAVKYNVFFDAVGLGDPVLYTHSEKYLAPNGMFISSGPQPKSFLSAVQLIWHAYLWPRWAGGTKRTYRFATTPIAKDELEEIRKSIAEGRLKPVVDSIYNFEDVLEAYTKLMTGHARGKIVIEPPTE